MKKTLFTLACALGLTVCTQAQVVLQSDFETWTGVQAVSGWDGSKTNITTTPDSARKDSVGPYHGTYCVALVNPTTTSKRFSTQPLAITAGTVYNIRFWTKGIGVIRTGLQGVKYSNGFGYEYGSYITVNSTTWAVNTQTLLADTNNTAAQFLFSVKSTVGNLALDSVTITAVGTATNVSLYQVQYTTASPANSPFMNQYVTTGGIVTAVYNGSGGTQSGYYIQTSNAHSWSAVNVYDYSHIVLVGDSVTFSGQVQEYYNETEIANVVNFTKVSSGNQAHTPTTLVGFNTIQNEMYEGMLIKANGVKDVRYNVAAAWYVFSDSTMTGSINNEDTVDNIIYTYGYTQGKKYNITGVVHFEYANWIEPRNVNDIDSINVIQGIQTIENNYTDVAVYPNPNNGAFTVSVNVLADEKNTNFILTDLTGRVIYKEQLDTHAGLNAYQINTSNIAKGTYFFEISNVQAKTVKKIIVQ
ncbi:MAG TPA: T9SS type A sorting domain-containing protein [Bacteroidia bacterium]|nr:T9SS type A sorting domain-containing protein [Bacteroidia bacterium]